MKQKSDSHIFWSVVCLLLLAAMCGACAPEPQDQENQTVIIDCDNLYSRWVEVESPRIKPVFGPDSGVIGVYENGTDLLATYLQEHCNVYLDRSKLRR